MPTLRQFAQSSDVMGVLNDQSATLKEDGILRKLFELNGRRVFVAGHRGLVGSAIVRRLAEVECDLVTVGRDRLDLLRQSDTERFLLFNKARCRDHSGWQSRRYPCEQHASG